MKIEKQSDIKVADKNTDLDCMKRKSAWDKAKEKFGRAKKIMGIAFATAVISLSGCEGSFDTDKYLHDAGTQHDGDVGILQDASTLSDAGDTNMQQDGGILCSDNDALVKIKLVINGRSTVVENGGSVNINGKEYTVHISSDNKLILSSGDDITVIGNGEEKEVNGVPVKDADRCTDLVNYTSRVLLKVEYNTSSDYAILGENDTAAFNIDGVGFNLSSNGISQCDSGPSVSLSLKINDKNYELNAGNFEVSKEKELTLNMDSGTVKVSVAEFAVDLFPKSDAELCSTTKMYVALEVNGKEVNVEEGAQIVESDVSVKAVKTFPGATDETKKAVINVSCNNMSEKLNVSKGDKLSLCSTEIDVKDVFFKTTENEF
ncbi:MAG: hypothetical protein ACP5KJ_00505 [Candidatus Micrarchaeia archaeon]